MDGTHIQFFIRLDLSFSETIHHVIPRDSSPLVTLRIEEYLTVANIHRGGMLKVMHGQVEKVFPL